MRIGRRALLKAGAAGIAASSAAARATARPAALIVFDSRIPASAAYAPAGKLRVDVASEDANLWRSLRKVPPEGRIAGITRWSDLVLVRGFLEEQGRRMTRTSRRGELFEWEMA